MAMGQQVLQSLAEAGAGGGSSSSQSSGPLQGVDFSRLLNQMMPVVSQALGVAGPTDGPHSANAPHHADPGEEGITQVKYLCHSKCSCLFSLKGWDGGVDFSYSDGNWESDRASSKRRFKGKRLPGHGRDCQPVVQREWRWQF